MEDIEKLWGGIVEASIKMYAKNQPPELREDLKQECWVRIMENLESIQNVAKDQAKYVSGMCCNLIIDRMRSVDYRTETLTNRNEPVIFLDTEDTVITIDTAIKKLPRSEQYVVRSLYYGRATEDDVAASLGQTVHWVRTKHQLCLDKLKVLMEKK